MVHLDSLDPEKENQLPSEGRKRRSNPIRKLGPIELSVSHPIAQFVLALSIPGGIFALIFTDRPVPDALWAALGSIIVFFFVNGRLQKPD